MQSQRCILFVDKLSRLEREVSNSIRLQVNAAWTPQYCKKYGIVKLGSETIVQGSSNQFVAHKVVIPHVTQSNSGANIIPPGLKLAFFFY